MNKSIRAFSLILLFDFKDWSNDNHQEYGDCWTQFHSWKHFVEDDFVEDEEVDEAYIAHESDEAGTVGLVCNCGGAYCDRIEDSGS